MFDIKNEDGILYVDVVVPVTIRVELSDSDDEDDEFNINDVNREYIIQKIEDMERIDLGEYVLNHVNDITI